MQLPEIVKVETHDLKPGDIVVLYVNGQMSRQVSDNIHKSLQPVFKDQKLLVLEQGMALEVYRQANQDALDG